MEKTGSIFRQLKVWNHMMKYEDQYGHRFLQHFLLEVQNLPKKLLHLQTGRVKKWSRIKKLLGFRTKIHKLFDWNNQLEIAQLWYSGSFWLIPFLLLWNLILQAWWRGNCVKLKSTSKSGTRVLVDNRVPSSEILCRDRL